MNREKAIEIINKTRIENPFTMGLSIDEFIKQFRKRYSMIFGEIIPNDYIAIAECINKIDSGSGCLK